MYEWHSKTFFPLVRLNMVAKQGGWAAFAGAVASSESKNTNFGAGTYEHEVHDKHDCTLLPLPYTPHASRQKVIWFDGMIFKS